MALWTFDLRSSDSDMEDEDDSLNTTLSNHLEQHHIDNTRQGQINQELDELFGAPEETVEYKPNPWSIAKINANSRNTVSLPKPTPKKIWKPGNFGSKSSGLGRYWKNPKAVKDGYVVSPKTSPNTGKSLRVSISEALRRGAPATSPVQEQSDQVQLRTQEVEKPMDGSEPRLDDTAPSLDTHKPPSNPIRPPADFHQEALFHEFTPNEPSAYIPDRRDTTPVFDQSPHAIEGIQHLDASNERFPGDIYPPDELAVSVPGTGYQHPQDDDLCSALYRVYDENSFSGGSVHTPVKLGPNLQSKNTFGAHTPDRFGAASSQLGPGCISPNQIRLASPYSGNFSGTALEPSPTVQLIASFAAPKFNESVVVSEYSEVCLFTCLPTKIHILIQEKYSDPKVYPNESPGFAHSPPSPIPCHTQPNHNRTYPPHTPNRTSYPARKPFSTPPRNKTKTKKFDPDDKPFWSTLPTPPNSTRRPLSGGIKTTRFHLPGSFLAGGSGSGSNGRTLYKPPPRKRSRSREDESGGTRWKVTRVG
ncbi:unnamed protein product [Rhizoctonia solani]|uniref:Uncharacterized protein n=1 Tax=Rhizoctonia solani TaxID=456999 RepID=A0A8H3HYS3_9AGAM|nr:unnamed protein product [Rhizoctonia solani]